MNGAQHGWKQGKQTLPMESWKGAFSVSPLPLVPHPPWPWPPPPLISLGWEKRLLVVIHLPAAHPFSFISAQGLAVGLEFRLPEMLGFTSNIPKMGIREMSLTSKLPSLAKGEEVFFSYLRGSQEHSSTDPEPHLGCSDLKRQGTI